MHTPACPAFLLCLSLQRLLQALARYSLQDVCRLQPPHLLPSLTAPTAAPSHACSLCLVNFESHPDYGTMLAVGTAQGLKFYPKHCDSESGCMIGGSWRQ